MSNKTLKPGWKIWRFEQMATNVKDRIDRPVESGLERYVGLEHLDTGSLKIWRWGSTTDVEKQKLLFKKGDIIFGRRNAYLRRVAVADFDGVCSAHALVLRAKEKVVLPEFLPFFMQTDLFWEAALKVSAGSMSPTINWSNIAKEEFPLPPLAEQHRLAEVLWAVEENIRGQQNLSLSALQVAQSLTDNVFDLSIVRSFLLRQQSEETLNLVPLKQLCTVQVGYPFKSSEYVESGDRLMRCSNVGVDSTDWSPDRTKFWPTEQRNQFQDYILQSGDIVIAMDRPFVGDGFKIAEISESDLPALLLQRVGRFQIGPDIDRGYLWCFLHSSSFMLQLLSQQQGTDLPHISKFDIEGAAIPFLSISEQIEIGNEYRDLVNAAQYSNNRLNDLQLLKTQVFQEVLES